VVKRRIAELQDSRDPVMVAGIVSDMRVINGNRGRVAIFKLDDKSDAIEAVVNEELLNANKELLAEDELIIASGKVQNDRFSGGLRMNIQQVWSLAAARARFGRYVYVPVRRELPPLAELLRQWPAKRVEGEQGSLVQGLKVRTHHFLAQGQVQLDLGEDSRFWPCEEALQLLQRFAPPPAAPAGAAGAPAQPAATLPGAQIIYD
jgi:DNA polymerase-3 subunit alpha